MERRLAAILAADMVGYSRLIRAGSGPPLAWPTACQAVGSAFAARFATTECCTPRWSR